MDNDELELTELEQAEWVARRWSDLSSVPSSYVEARLLARVFLAQQARLAEVERERDALAKREIGVDPEFAKAYEREKTRRIAAERETGRQHKENAE